MLPTILHMILYKLMRLRVWNKSIMKCMGACYSVPANLDSCCSSVHLFNFLDDCVLFCEQRSAQLEYLNSWAIRSHETRKLSKNTKNVSLEYISRQLSQMDLFFTWLDFAWKEVYMTHISKFATNVASTSWKYYGQRLWDASTLYQANIVSARRFDPRSLDWKRRFHSVVTSQTRSHSKYLSLI